MRKWFRPLPVWVALMGLLVLGEVLAPPSGSWRFAAHMAVIGFPSLVLALAVHELGHLLGGYLPVSMSGQRPREWDPGLITRATQLPDGSPEHGVGCMLAYARALDLGDGEIARAHLERARILFGKMPLLKTPIGL